MARPIKKGLSYFPKDTTTYSNRKIRRLRRDTGLEGLAIWDFLLCQIYANGYEIAVDTDYLFDAAEDLKTDESIIENVIKSAIKHNLFSAEIYDEFKRLTSRSIQEQYVKICEDARRKYHIASEYSLITTEATTVNTAETPATTVETKVKTAETPPKETLSTQRKEKKRKEKERKEKLIPISDFENRIVRVITKFQPYILTDQEKTAAGDLLQSLVDALEQRKQVANLDNVTNLFCLIYESLSPIDRQNFTLSYLVKHINRIFSNLKIWSQSQKRKR